MTDSNEWRERILSAIRGASIPLVPSPGVSAPDSAALVIIRLDEEAETVVRTFTDMNPAAMIVTDADDDGFSVHVVGQPWVQLTFATTESLDREDGSADTIEELDDAERALVSAAVRELAHAIPLSSHGKAFELESTLREHIGQHLPHLAGKVERRFAIFEYANDLDGALKDRHTTLLRTDAQRLAAEIAAAEPPTPGMRRPVLRELVYSHLKRVDPTCVTKTSVEAVVGEYALLAAQR